MGSTNITWTEMVDLYAADGTTLLASGVPAYVELASANSRVALQDVSHSTVAQLWTGIEQKGTVADGTRIFRTATQNWWTVRGMPRVFEGIGDAHLEATISAETPDAFFSSLAKPKALIMTFESIATATEMQLEISELPDFSTTVMSVLSSDDQTGWFYVTGDHWAAVPSSGLPSQAKQTFVFFTSELNPLKSYFLRWTPGVNGNPQTAQVMLSAV